MHRRFAIVLVLGLLCLAVTAAPTAAQDGAALISMEIDAAYDGFFRDDQWMPVRVTVTNNGDDIDGRLVVRPETSRGVGGTFSVPLALPTNSRKTDFIYVTARAFTTTLRVELMDNADDLVLASVETGLRQIQPADQLYVVLTQSAAGSIDLTRARAEGMSAFQANWEIDALPDNAMALASINMMAFTDIDTGGLTLAQEAALETWVADGGHLVATGGPNWQATAAGLSSLLPLVPTDSTNVEDLSPLATYFGGEAELTDETVIATGDLTEDAHVLVTTEDGLPLVVRRTLGEGTIDYITADPNVAPLRGWGGLSSLWYTLATTREPVPNWAQGFARWEPGAAAAEILPGLDVLPSVLPLCGFLALYIVLIGPLNYIVLNRINRREYAWLTMPVLILIFSGLAYVVGGQLRGNEPSIGRLTLVQSWPDVTQARTTQIFGLLSPQRTQYTLETGDDTFLRTIPRPENIGSGTLLSSNFETSIEVEQGTRFRAVEFPVDASFVAGFAAYDRIERPEIGGSVTLFYPPREQLILTDQLVRGSVRNDSEATLNDVVILARSAAHRLRDPLAPGDVATFEFRIDGDEPPAPAPIGYMAGQINLGTGYSPYSSYNYGGASLYEQTAFEIMGNQSWQYNAMQPNVPGIQRNNEDTITQQEQRRRQLFLMSLMVDPFVSTQRGNKVYAVGWANTTPTENITLESRTFRPFDTSLYVIELAVEVQHPSERLVRIGSDQFVWSVHEKNGLGEVAPVNLSLPTGNSVAFRYTPLPQSRLATVEEVAIITRNTSGGRSNIPVQLWNWDEEAWENHVITNDRLALEEPERFVGPQNAVILRLFGDDSNYLNLESIAVEQVGTFVS